MRLPQGLTPLRERDYALYLAGQVLSHSGTALETTATSWLLYALTNSPLLLGVGGLFRTVPLLLLVVVGGAVADRLSRRAILVATQLGFLASSALLGALVATDLVEPWHVYLFNLASATFNAFDVPARQALFPTLVPRGQIGAAVSLNAAGARAANLVGPAVAGVVIAFSGLAAPYFLNAASYLALLGALLAMRRVPRSEGGAGRFRRQVGEVFVHVRHDAVLFPLLVLEALGSLFGHNTALLTIFARDVLGAGPQGLGILRSSIAAGALVGLGVLVLAREIERKGSLVLVAGLGYAAALVAFALSPSLLISAALLLGLGVADALWNATRNVIAQLVTPDAMRGRVMSIVVLVSRGVTQLSELQTGALVTVLAPAGAAVAGALAIAVSTVAIAGASGNLRAYRTPRALPLADAQAAEASTADARG